MHLILDSIYAEQYFVGLAAMIIGAEIRRINISWEAPKWKYGILFIVLFISFLVLKIMRGKGIEYLGFIHLAIGIVTILIGSVALIFGVQYKEPLERYFNCHRVNGKLIKTISNGALATYYVSLCDNSYLIRMISRIGHFPISYIVCILVILCIAFLVTRMQTYIRIRRSSL